MGRKDSEEKNFFNDNLHFADVCNGIMFQGAKIMIPEELEESDTELVYPNKKMSAIVRLDGMRYWRKQGVNIALLGLEYQSLTDYHMVFRNMMAESLAYYKQWKQNKGRYSQEYAKWIGKIFRLRNAKEIVSGMTKEDKFVPVIIIVLNCSLEKWDGATTLHEMLKLPNELKRYVNNYKMNIFDYHEYDDFSIFKTEVRVIFEALKTAGDEEKMNKVFERVKKIGIDAARLLEELLKVKFNKQLYVKEDDGKEYVQVCKAWEDHWKSGQKQGIEQGIEQGTAMAITNVMKNLSVPATQAMDLVGILEEDRDKYANLLH